METMRKPLELYIHIPFCVKKCGYCDFISAPASEAVQLAYKKALLKEIRMAAGEIEKEAYEVNSVFFGGGTPSIINASYIEEIILCIRKEFFVNESAEITLEANPGTLTEKNLGIYRRAGVNRLSIGLQSADDRELAILGRIHTFEIFKESYRMARKAGFKNINVDLMAALPEQTENSFKNSLRAVTALEPCPPEHISVYSLIIEEGTPFFGKYHRQAEARAEGEEDTDPLPSEEAERNMYYETRRILSEYGYGRYEISNFARKGYECRHNIGYWDGVSYLGFGISAASYIEGIRFSNTPDLRKYLFSLEGQTIDLKKIRREEELVTPKRAMEEYMFLGLRMMKGISEKVFLERFGSQIGEIYSTVLDKMCEEGLMERYQNNTGENMDFCWRLTDRGIDVSNYVLAAFLL